MPNGYCEEKDRQEESAGEKRQEVTRAVQAKQSSGAGNAGPTCSREWLLTCLARWICAKPKLKERREFLDRWGRRHGIASRDALLKYVEREWRTASAKRA